ncbi:MAG: alpha/beta hydrolase [Bacteroidota bacterium]
MKPNLLMLHGALGAKTTFGASSGELNNYFQVYVMNFNGHGLTPKRDGHFNIHGFAEDVIAYLDESDLEKIDIFGYSMGGYVGLYLARHFPERINKVATLGTKLAWTADIASKEVRKLDPVKIKEKVPKFAAGLAKVHGDDHWETLLHDTGDLLKQLGESPLITDADFQAIEHHVRLCVGDNDHFVTIDETQDAFRQLENGSLSVIPNTGHLFNTVHVRDLVLELRRTFRRNI